MDSFVTRKLNALAVFTASIRLAQQILDYDREGGNEPGPREDSPPDLELVPWLLELNAIPSIYSFASCAGHSNRHLGEVDRAGYVWIQLDHELGDLIFPVDGSIEVTWPFQGDLAKLAITFDGSFSLDEDFAIVLTWLRATFAEDATETRIRLERCLDEDLRRSHSHKGDS